MTDDEVIRVEREAILALSHTKHLLLDSDSSGDELEDLRRNNLDGNRMTEQRLLEIEEEFAAALHGREAVSAQQELAGSYAALQTHEAIAAAQGSLDGVSNNVPHDLSPTATGPSLKNSIQFQEPAAPQALQSQQTIAAAQETPKLEPRSYYEFHNYVPTAIPPVPSIQHLIQICSKPFEKQLTKGDVTEGLLKLKNCDAARHVLPWLKPYEDPKEGIWTTVYDIAGIEYNVMFKATRVCNSHALAGKAWKHFVEHHGLVQYQDFVTLWAFRNAQTGKLCFVISSRRLPVFKSIGKVSRQVVEI